MRKFAAITAVIVLLAAGGGSAGPPKDFVAGGGQHLAFGIGPDIVNFGITAHSGPAGENPTGSMTFQIEGSPALHADVTCLMVDGNRAIATGISPSRSRRAARSSSVTSWTTAVPAIRCPT